MIEMSDEKMIQKNKWSSKMKKEFFLLWFDLSQQPYMQVINQIRSATTAAHRLLGTGTFYSLISDILSLKYSELVQNKKIVYKSLFTCSTLTLHCFLRYFDWSCGPLIQNSGKKIYIYTHIRTRTHILNKCNICDIY